MLTCADNIDDVKTVSENITDVVAVGDNILDVNTVAADVEDVTLVADNIDYVKDVAEGIEGLPVSGYSGDTPPTQPKVGATWYCTLDGRNYIWYADADSGQWVESSPQSTADDPHLAGNIFTLWKRSAAEAGYTLVAGSFEEGGTLTSPTDVLWHKKTNSIYSWVGTYSANGYVVPPNTDPVDNANYVSRTNIVPRTDDLLASRLYNARSGVDIIYAATGDDTTGLQSAIASAHITGGDVIIYGQCLISQVVLPAGFNGSFLMGNNTAELVQSGVTVTAGWDIYLGNTVYNAMSNTPMIYGDGVEYFKLDVPCRSVNEAVGLRDSGTCIIGDNADITNNGSPWFGLTFCACKYVETMPGSNIHDCGQYFGLNGSNSNIYGYAEGLMMVGGGTLVLGGTVNHCGANGVKPWNIEHLRVKSTSIIKNNGMSAIQPVIQLYKPGANVSPFLPVLWKSLTVEPGAQFLDNLADCIDFNWNYGVNTVVCSSSHPTNPGETITLDMPHRMAINIDGLISNGQGYYNGRGNTNGDGTALMSLFGVNGLHATNIRIGKCKTRLISCINVGDGNIIDGVSALNNATGMAFGSGPIWIDKASELEVRNVGAHTAFNVNSPTLEYWAYTPETFTGKLVVKNSYVNCLDKNNGKIKAPFMDSTVYTITMEECNITGSQTFSLIPDGLGTIRDSYISGGPTNNYLVVLNASSQKSDRLRGTHIYSTTLALKLIGSSTMPCNNTGITAKALGWISVLMGLNTTLSDSHVELTGSYSDTVALSIQSGSTNCAIANTSIKNVSTGTNAQAYNCSATGVRLNGVVVMAGTEVGTGYTKDGTAH